MANEIIINVNESGGTTGTIDSLRSEVTQLSEMYEDLKEDHRELMNTMGDDYGSFPEKGLDGFLSHFIITMELLMPGRKGEVISLTMPTAMQTVSRSKPFIYQGPQANHEIYLDMPKHSKLGNTIKEGDFLHRPADFFEVGKETVWMQILNLDARMDDTPIGPIRIILGETVKAEYPEIFQPSLGVAQSLSKQGGFPARLFFNPYAIIETEFGAMRAIHGTLSYGRTVEFPPIATPISICECIPLEPVEQVMKTKAYRAVNDKIAPIARIIALSHPIDTMMQLPGEEACELVDRCIEKGAKIRAKGKK